MKDKQRRNRARKRAETYAPRPVSSLLMYGIVGVGLAGLAWAAFSRFYDLDPFAHPIWITSSLIAAFAGAVVLWLVRSRRHTAAHRREYDKGD